MDKIRMQEQNWRNQTTKIDWQATKKIIRRCQVRYKQKKDAIQYIESDTGTSIRIQFERHLSFVEFYLINEIDTKWGYNDIRERDGTNNCIFWWQSDYCK